jgi:hypothetical protein
MTARERRLNRAALDRLRKLVRDDDRAGQTPFGSFERSLRDDDRGRRASVADVVALSRMVLVLTDTLFPRIGNE